MDDNLSKLRDIANTSREPKRAELLAQLAELEVRRDNYLSENSRKQQTQEKPTDLNG